MDLATVSLVELLAASDVGAVTIERCAVRSACCRNLFIHMKTETYKEKKSWAQYWAVPKRWRKCCEETPRDALGTTSRGKDNTKTPRDNRARSLEQHRETIRKTVAKDDARSSLLTWATSGEEGEGVSQDRLGKMAIANKSSLARQSKRDKQTAPLDVLAEGGA